MPEFKLKSDYLPAGGQPEAIRQLVQGARLGIEEQTMLGVTGAGKTFVMANVIQQLQRPTLVLTHNKTLAAQLCSEFREFFPDNAVEFFVSYYDYYQPEAYIPSTDTYIEKDSDVNAELDRLRHSATSSLFERRDVIIVASVSCIYSLGNPIDYANMVISLRTGQTWDRDALCRKLVELQYERNDLNFDRNRFRVRGDTMEIRLAYTDDYAIRVEFSATRSTASRRSIRSPDSPCACWITWLSILLPIMSHPRTNWKRHLPTSRPKWKSVSSILRKTAS